MNPKILYLIWVCLTFISCNSTERNNDKNGRLLSELIEEKKVEMHFFESSIKMIQIGLEINSWHDIKIIIPAGTNLIPTDDSIQTMVSTQDIEILAEDDWVKVEIPVACSNLHKKAPNSRLIFDIKHKSQNKELNNLFEYIHEKKLNLPYEIVQSAVWIISDNASYYDLLSLRIKEEYRGYIMPYGKSVISAKMAAEGINLCANAGINIYSKRIYNEFNNIYDDLSPNERQDYYFLKQK